MSRRLLSAALGLALGACATAPSAKLAVCDGRHRRPANPNGSLLTAGERAPAATPAPLAPPPASADEAASERPCGDHP